MNSSFWFLAVCFRCEVCVFNDLALNLQSKDYRGDGAAEEVRVLLKSNQAEKYSADILVHSDFPVLRL